jgi:hypothetical protein
VKRAGETPALRNPSDAGYGAAAFRRAQLGSSKQQSAGLKAAATKQPYTENHDDAARIDAL